MHRGIQNRTSRSIASEAWPPGWQLGDNTPCCRWRSPLLLFWQIEHWSHPISDNVDVLGDSRREL